MKINQLIKKYQQKVKNNSLDVMSKMSIYYVAEILTEVSMLTS